MYNEFMSEVATKSDIAKLDKKIDDSFSDITDLLRGFIDQVDERFQKVEYELTNIKSEIVDLKESHNRLLNTVDGFVSRIDKYETELSARDNQFAKLLEWARKVSEKTGIPLENL